MVHTPARIGEESSSDPAFPWQLGIYDAHCHPTDTMDGLKDIHSMRARVLTIMATREQDQELVSNAASRYELDLDKFDAQGDAGTECQVLPAFGWHPWFSHQIFDDTGSGEPPEKLEHYRSVLQPVPGDDFLEGLSSPLSLKAYLCRAKSLLERHPQALIGEIGMDRGMRIPENTTDGRTVDPQPGLTPGGRENKRLSPFRIDVNHQARILIAQLHLAGELQRAVSVHGVAAHGFLYDTLEKTWKGHERKITSRRQLKHAHPGDLGDETGRKPFPPRICLHSFSGPPETIRRYLNRANPAKIFFSFSHVINFSHGSNKAVESIKAVPNDRILIESDLHKAGEQMDDLLAQVAQMICEIKGWTLEEGVKQLANNWKHFALGLEV